MEVDKFNKTHYFLFTSIKQIYFMKLQFKKIFQWWRKFLYDSLLRWRINNCGIKLMLHFGDNDYGKTLMAINNAQKTILFPPRKTFFMQTSLFICNILITRGLVEVTLVTLTSPQSITIIDQYRGILVDGLHQNGVSEALNHRPIYPYIGRR